MEHVIAGLPAEEAGIQVDDILTHLDGQPVSGKDYGDVRQKLMGTGKVNLTLRRGDETFKKTLGLRQLI